MVVVVVVIVLVWLLILLSGFERPLQASQREPPTAVLVVYESTHRFGGEG